MIATTTAADPKISAPFFPQWKRDEAMTTKTPPGKCLLSCNKTIGEVDAILTCGHTYMEDRPPIIHQNLTVFKMATCMQVGPVWLDGQESMIATTTAADPVIIATFFPQWKGDEAITTKTHPGKCLLSCNKTIGDVDAIQTCGNTYMEDRPPMIHQNLTVLFHGGHPLPLCKSGCSERSSSEGEAILATKFKYIWTLLDLLEAVLPEYLSETATGAKHKTTTPSPAAASTAP
uniref:Uncharacterized protein n=1 Tax=Oryza rufipogon TaxID=4529 RepID=A0A0E0R573_ORYRU